MSNYYVQTYGAFIKEHEEKIRNELGEGYLTDYTKKWNAAVSRLIESGVDLSKIVIVGREQQRK